MKKKLLITVGLLLGLSFGFSLPFIFSSKGKRANPPKNKIYISQKFPFIQVKKLWANDLEYRPKKDLQLDFALTDEQREWGMMGRSQLEENQGLCFVFPRKSYRTFWMYNCLLDLSLVFLDDDKIIREIHELKAFPSKVSQIPKIKTISDLRNHSKNDPLVQFFSKRGKKSSFPCRYAVEMRMGWFKDNHYHLGDVITFDPQRKISHIYASLDFSDVPQSPYPTLIEFPESDYHPLSSSREFVDAQLVFLNEQDIVQEIIVYQHNASVIYEKEVVVPNFSYKKVVIFPKKHPQIAKIFIGSPIYLGAV